MSKLSVLIHDSFSRQSLRRKLITIMVGISTMTLFLIATLFLTDSYYHSRETLKLKLDVVGSIMSRELVAAIVYTDDIAASETLSSVEDVTAVTKSCLYDIQGKLFASYTRSTAFKNICDTSLNIHEEVISYRNVKGGVIYGIPIIHNGETVGFLHTHASIHEVIQLTFYRFSYLLMGVCFSALLAYAIATRLQNVISMPIITLSQTAQRYALEKDTKLRAKKFNDDEIGELVTSFNNMLETIEEQNESLQDSNDELEQANIELEEFAYRTSHDLRSPIVSSLELLSVSEQYLKEGKVDDVAQCLTFSVNLMKKLETLISDILQLTTAKKKEEDDAIVDVQKIIKESIEKLSFMEHFNDLEIIEDYVDKPITTSKLSRVRMIVENLISNAIKYQDPTKTNPYIKISTYRQNDNFIVSVEDNGLGIPEDKRDKVFSMFSRFHPRVSFGSGLGLYLIKKSTDVIRGHIAYRALPKGSQFELTIPEKSSEQGDHNDD